MSAVCSLLLMFGCCYTDLRTYVLTHLLTYSLTHLLTYLLPSCVNAVKECCFPGCCLSGGCLRRTGGVLRLASGGMSHLPLFLLTSSLRDEKSGDGLSTSTSATNFELTPTSKNVKTALEMMVILFSFSEVYNYKFAVRASLRSSWASSELRLLLLRCVLLALSASSLLLV